MYCELGLAGVCGAIQAESLLFISLTENIQDPILGQGKHSMFNLKPLTPCWKARVGHLLHCMWMGKYLVLLYLT